jgi:hypothetical protein
VDSKVDGEQNPVDLRTGQPLKPREQPGYYPGFRTLDQANFWDAATREVVHKRVQEIPPLRFFNPDEARLMKVVCEHLLPQDDRDPEHRVPILPFIDERLYERRTPGYRFETMPPDGDAYRLGLQRSNRWRAPIISAGSATYCGASRTDY